ncbi:ABC transporter ATP-binding protein [Liquorilactobacillus oeni]|uniref:ABC-type quaternary amine transporter n=1 Tax=Liquorilactobacillus oeni DSM 19972 TaxID=1423777 RepID=A0A0R1MAM8_9LACO|nr:ABC transporter ATP-binding protein [Liquorilactobacillus oeni]KRL05094.1 glycine betaine proline transport system ATP-binding protein [Liquorilactobacillus oeni DSM 19972]
MTVERKTAIEFTHVQKKFGGKEVIADLNLTIPSNKIFALVGPSGSGKTTILKMINALVHPDGGEITINGKSLTNYRLQDLRWKIGYVLQQIALFPNMTVAQNVAVIPEMKKSDKAQLRKMTEKLLSQVDLPAEKYADRYPRELSGGEAQRVGIVRALAADPPMILMDEPFSALDPISREQLQKLVLRLQAKLHKTIVFVTHDMNEALKMGDMLAIVYQGKIQQVGSPQELQNNPATDYVARFFANTQKKNSLAATLSSVIKSGSAEVVQNKQIHVLTNGNQSILNEGKTLSAGKTLYVKDKQGVTWMINAETVLRFLTDQEGGKINGNEE